MASTTMAIDTNHEDMIHDAQMDYYGKRLATASSDRTIRIFDASSNEKQLTAELRGHEGPVWQVTWAHPKYGSVIASCSYDRKVLIWKEISKDQWKIVHTHTHSLSVNAVSWAPHEYGLCLACASSDGNISVVTQKDDTWTSVEQKAHSVGANSVSWAPPAQQQDRTMWLATGGCDTLVKIWRVTLGDGPTTITHKEDLSGPHTDWIRDVAWAPNIGLPYNTIASCSQEGRAVVWTKSDINGPGAWRSKQLLDASSSSTPVWRVSWSITGNVLAVSSGDNNVTLWKESTGEDQWVKISELCDGEMKSTQ